MKSPSESGIKAPSTTGARVPRHMRGRLEMGGTGEYLSGLRAAHEAAGIRKTTDLVAQNVTERTHAVLDNHTPLNHAISGGRLDSHLSEHAQHGSTSDYKEALITASILAKTLGQLAQ